MDSTRRELIAAFSAALLLPDYKPGFFSPDDFAALQAFTEILIPTDETPGAREARCAHYIDFVLQASSETPKVQAEWRKAMEALSDAGFHVASPTRRLEMVSEMDKSAAHLAHFAYKLIKQQTAFAFYTSKEGCIETLHYLGNSYNATFPACTHPEHQTV